MLRWPSASLCSLLDLHPLDATAETLGVASIAYGDNMKSRFLIVLAGSAALASGASARPGTATKYRPMYIFGGYSEKQIEPGIWRVTGRSNGIAEIGFGRNMAMYRAAEILSAHGFAYVQVVDQKGKIHSVGLDRYNLHPAGENLIMTVRGANSPEPPADCRAKKPEACGTYPVAATITRLRPLLHIGE
jgi:hypothetical protein